MASCGETTGGAERCPFLSAVRFNGVTFVVIDKKLQPISSVAPALWPHRACARAGLGAVLGSPGVTSASEVTSQASKN
jgi:hypothetical protein